MSVLDVDPGPWLSTKEAAPRIGRTQREVRILCETRQIEHQILESTSGGTRRRYRISEQAIARFLRRTIVRVGGAA